MITWSLDDLVRDFDVTRLGTSPSIFDPEKLRWMNGRYVRAMTDEWLGGRLVEYLTRVGFYGDPAGVVDLAVKGPQVSPPPSKTPKIEHLPPTVPDEEQEALTRAVAPLVHEKTEVPPASSTAGWLGRLVASRVEALERLRVAGVADPDRHLLLAAGVGISGRARPSRRRRAAADVELKPEDVSAAPPRARAARLTIPGSDSLPGIPPHNAVARLEQAAALVV